jgi:signal transduction histidine kinase
MSPTTPGRGHELRFAFADEPLEIDADPVRLEQVIVNLLNNSAKYTEPGGRIELELAREHGHAVVRVSDTGIGIGPELLPYVFDMFTQGDRALTRAGGGLGIGLTMVQKLVEMHGGQVDVRSDGLGLGSVFTVRLPARTDPALRGSVSVPSEPARLLSSGETA